LKEREREYCEELIKNKGNIVSQSKISTRPSTRQSRPLSTTGHNGSFDWLRHFDVLEASSEERLKEIRTKLEQENKEMVKEIEDLRVSILDTQQEYELQEETTSKTFTQQLLKELEKIYLSKKSVKPVVPIKKSIKLKAIVQTKDKEEVNKVKEDQKHKISKVHKLRVAVSESKNK